MNKDFGQLYLLARQSQKRINVLSAMVDRVWGKEFQATWARQDEQLMKYFHKKGAFGVLSRYELDNSEPGAFFFPRLGQAGKIKTSASLLGREIGLNIKDPVMGRWFTLLHEYSHQEHLAENNTQKTMKLLGQGQLSKDLAHWSFLPIGGCGAGNMIDEVFADSYAVMLLDQAVTRAGVGNEEYQTMVKQLIKSRKKGQREDELIFQEQVLEGDFEYLDEAYHIYTTGWAIEKIQETRQNWINFGFEQIKEYAMELAVESWRRNISPELRGVRNFPLGVALRVYSLPKDPDEVMGGVVQVMIDSLNDYANPKVIEHDLKAWPESYAKIGLITLKHLLASMKKKDQGEENKTDWEQLLAQDPTGELSQARMEIIEEWKQAKARVFEAMTEGQAKELISQHPSLAVLFGRHKKPDHSDKVGEKRGAEVLKRIEQSGTMTP